MITATTNNTDNTGINRKKKEPENKNGIKNNCMIISSDKQAKSLGHGLERKISNKKLNHHYHHVVISQTLSRHFSLSFIASSRSSGLYPVSSHSRCMYVRDGRPALARPYVGVHRSTSFMSLSLLLQLCSACLVRLTWIVFVMGSRCYGMLLSGLV